MSHCLVLLLSVAIFCGWRDFRTKLDTITSDRAKLQSSLASVPANESIYGSPPVPNRPSKLKEISGTYYRGNCERNVKLFNGGNYRTATFHLGLVGPDHQQIELGAPVKNVPLAIRFEIERAPKTAAEFFTRKTTDRIYLSEDTVRFPSTKPPTSKPVCLETIQPEQRWGGFFPIGTVPDGERATMSGLIYVVVGVAEGDSVTGQIHYGIKYDLVFENGKIVDGSDLWMGELYITTPIAPPRPDKVPLNEWFDYRPIPDITGENTTDRKLLGIDTLSGGPDDPESKK